MSYRALCEALLSGKPYLGLALRAMQGPPERHRYFQPLVEAASKLLPCPLTILEIGSWAGASAISWGTALRNLGLEGQITCVDPWLPYFDTSLDTMSVYQEMNRAAEGKLIHKLFLHNIAAAGLQDVIQIKEGHSRQVLPPLYAQTYSIVYIDASHSYKDVIFDIREAKRLLRDGGILCGDDLELEMGAIDPGQLADAVQGGKDYVFSETLNQYYHPGVTMAVGEAIGPVSSWEGLWATRLSQGRCEKVALDLTSATLPSHIAPFQRQIEGEAAGYDLYSENGRYLAVSHDVPSGSPVDLLADNDLPPWIFVGGSLQEVTQKAEAAARRVTSVSAEPRIVDQHRGFNIVTCKDAVYALRQSIGEVNLSLSKDILRSRYSEHDLVVGASPDAIKARIECIELSRIVESVAQKITDLTGEIAVMRSESAPDVASGQRNCSGFNLIPHQGRIYAFRNSPGQVDLAIGDDALKQRYGPNDLVIGSSVEAVKIQINLLESVNRIQGEMDSLRDRLSDERPAWFTEFSGELAKIVDELANERERTRSVMRTVELQAEDANRRATTVGLALDLVKSQIDRVNDGLGQVTALVDELHYGLGDRQTPQEVERYRGFRLVLEQGKIRCIPDGAKGRTASFESGSPNPELAKVRIDSYLAEQAVTALEARVAASGLRGIWRKWFSR